MAVRYLRTRAMSGRGGRWWDAEWRKEHLAKMRDKRAKNALGRAELQERIAPLLQAQATQPEVRIEGEAVSRDTVSTAKAMANEHGLHCKSYGSGTKTVLVMSREPLPDYRADLDLAQRSRSHEVDMSIRSQKRVEAALKDAEEARARQVKWRKHAKKREPTWNDASEASSRPSARADADPPKPCERTAERALEFRRKLPAWTLRGEFLRKMVQEQVLVVSGETGCGKTTQLPQFLLEQAVEERTEESTNIICTQPRRISAISVAQRVANERGEALGERVGYQIRMESKRSMHTRLLFCTTGVLLRRLASDPLLKDVTHVIVDEIHERGMNEDFLLIVLRDLLPVRPDLKLILMSATLNPELFSNYFNQAPVMHIPGFTYPVQDVFLEDILEESKYTVQDKSNKNSTSKRWYDREKKGGQNEGQADLGFDPADYSSFSSRTVRSLSTWYSNKEKGVDLELAEAAITHIAQTEGNGAILVFLTGWDEISKLFDACKLNPVLGDASRCTVLPLHGSMPTTSQRQIFERPPKDIRKIVLATNIAETSITIDDVVYVVDCGKAKEKTYDVVNKLACLLPTWISRAAVKQRRGRAGRCQAGKCYHLFPRRLHESMEEYQMPELLRTPLEELCLQIKSLQLGGVEPFLAKAVTPPDGRSVHNSLERLRFIGALDADEDLTPLGKHLAHLPVDPSIGKMLILGAVLGCLNPVLTVAAGMAYRDPFILPLDKKKEADMVKQGFGIEHRSDHIAVLNAYSGWMEARRRGRAAAREYCWDNFLSYSTMEMIADMRRQFLDLLGEIGFVHGGFRPWFGNASEDEEDEQPSRGSSLRDLELEVQSLSSHAKDLTLLRAVLCAGMFPNIVSVHQKKRIATFKTHEDGAVTMHPSSVNSAQVYYPHRWLVYSDKVKSTGIYIRASTMVSDYALLLFGGDLEPGETPGSFSMCDGYYNFSASSKVAELIQHLRRDLHDLLAQKVEDPRLDLLREGGPIVQACLALLHAEDEESRVHSSFSDMSEHRYHRKQETKRSAPRRGGRGGPGGRGRPRGFG